MALRIKLVRGMSGHPGDHRATVRGLGLTRVGRERIVADNPSIRGMIEKVGYLLEVQETNQEFAPFGRRARAKAQRESKQGTAGSAGAAVPSPS
jgi:large subunit ribosomal protein L30